VGAGLYNAALGLPELRGCQVEDQDAQVAQLVEHAIENRSVAGSIPALGTTAFPFIPSFDGHARSPRKKKPRNARGFFRSPPV
jgi:hypothetical protein